ncbi:MAG: NAD(P)H-dependent oxidoreductase [Ignavibacteriaceae bacterium]
MNKKIFIPVILGTPRKGRKSEFVAKFVFEETKKKPEVETEFIDLSKINLATDDEGEQIKDNYFSEVVDKADGLIFIVPEYNHGYPGMLKHLIDSNLKEYIHKAVGICGVSAGAFGGTRVIENLLPVMREVGLVTIFWDGNFGNVNKLFDSTGKIIDEAYYRRIDKFLNEMIWMSKTLRYGRENIMQ